MKTIFLALLLVGVAFAMPDFTESEEDFEKEFKVLDSDPKEKEVEAEILKETEDEINENNKEFAAGNSTYEQALYPESDLPKAEFEKEKEGLVIPTEEVQERSLGLIMPPVEQRNTPENAAKLALLMDEINRQAAPSSYDANAAGLVTTAKNQRSCGSCAAFAATGLHETCMIKAGASMSNLDLSEQFLVDCGFNGGSMNACNGAYPHAYPDYFYNTQSGTSPHEASYPYLNRDPLLSCPSTTNAPKWDSGAYVSNSVHSYQCSEDTMKGLVASKGAVLSGIFASDTGFSNYKSGVFSGCSSTTPNHAILVVGYGTENNVDYWLVKNSWGSYWGDSGFFKIRRGTGECGIGDVCVTSECTRTGTAAPAPVAPTPAPVQPNLQCDISNLFGRSDITGNYNLHVGTSSGLIVSEVTCTNSVCTPRTAGPSNACMYICGRDPC